MKSKWLQRPVEYLPVWHAMEQFTRERDAATDDEIWLVEHSPVYTLGQGGLPEHILNPHAIPVVHCNRGGQVTYHGPGQLVMYTLMDLRRSHIYVREFVRLIEQSVLDLLADLGIASACRKPGAPGIYVPQTALQNPHGHDLAKIAALGLKVSKGCTYHGVALNVDMDLTPFAGINPCGFSGLQTVDIKSCGVAADLVTIGEKLAGFFQTAYIQSIQS